MPFQLLVSPMLDDRTTLDSTRPETLVWSPASNRFGWTADLTGLPPAWLAEAGVGPPRWSLPWWCHE
ncbi:hypothetical protein [Amycolatopsis albispora]|uniref:Uncharacterized protein n=1 Tax=Amycolatopsis albispora TaxID=1804986 RepID=A0A344L415_9PSEU|nr:hypothetical protein [Amycolatopsis albispora]AXB42789.1 hypothetical protein A4R43_09805 [Amycolatopsis albispora]